MNKYEKIVAQFNSQWIPLINPKIVASLVPRLSGMYEIFTVDGEFVDAYWNSRKEIWTSEDGGSGYDALAYRNLQYKTY